MTYTTPTLPPVFTAFLGRPFTPPRDRMADAAALLMRDPSQNIPALIAALDAINGRGCTQVITEMLNKEAMK